MIDRSTSPQQTAGFGRAASIMLPVILFAVMLLFGVVVTLRYAHGWTDVLAAGASAATPMAADGVAGLATVLLTALGVVFFYLRQLAR